MRWSRLSLLLLIAAVGCGEAPSTAGATEGTSPIEADGDAALATDAGGSSATPWSGNDAGIVPGGSVRIMAGNISSGMNSSYDPGEGIRIFQGLHPDIALIQEWNYKTNSEADIQSFVTTTFGADFTYFRESGMRIPNGIVSRYPIVASGTWDDPAQGMADRSFVYAKIALPGQHTLWAVSVHLLTSGSPKRATEATALVNELRGVVGADDFLVIGGDFNTGSRTEPCVRTLGQLVETKAPYPADQAGKNPTNASRKEPYDWVMVNKKLAAFQMPTVVGASSFPAGLVFDSRVYTPLADVAPVLKSDSAAMNMQHRAVVKDFRLQ
jgi:endonuclease/exonuclease/phosphatase family metal-dependent hydrolase